jgi:hypothetical protein
MLLYSIVLYLKESWYLPLNRGRNGRTVQDDNSDRDEQTGGDRCAEDSH